MKDQFTLQQLINIFTREAFPADESGFSQVPYEIVFNQLNVMFPEGWESNIVSAGVEGNGNNYVAVNLTLPLSEGKITRPGAADGPIGIPGLTIMAIRNAALRGFGMGLELYEKDEDIPAPKPTRAASKPPKPRGKTYGNENAGNVPSKYGEWTGEARLKSGKYERTKWKDLPLDYLMFLNSSGENKFAAMELSRRGVGSPSTDKSGLPGRTSWDPELEESPF